MFRITNKRLLKTIKKVRVLSGSLGKNQMPLEKIIRSSIWSYQVKLVKIP